MKRSFLLVLFSILLLSYQNCSIYKSDGIEEFKKELLLLNTGDQCLPFVDSNQAAVFMNAGGIDVSATAGDPRQCEFVSRGQASGLTGKVHCEVTTRSGNSIELRAQDVEFMNDPNNSLTDKESRITPYISPIVAGSLRIYSYSNGNFFGYAYETFESNTSYVKVKYVGGSFGADPSNVCSGGACGVCTIILQDRTISTLAPNQSDENQLKSTLESFLATITESR